MINRGARLLIGTLLGACFSVTALAQQSGFYLGGALGQSIFNEWCVTDGSLVFSACDDKGFAWKLLGGYRFNRNLGAEASYIDWGKVTAATTAGARVEADQQSYGIAAVGSLELGPQFTVFGKLGFLRTQQDTRRITPAPTTVKRKETEFHYGLGVKYSLTGNWGLRAEWENTDKLEVQFFSIGVEFTF
jgi:OOP family OmpA-OmpF porin